MVEASEHVTNLERPAKRCRLVERHQYTAIDLKRILTIEEGITGVMVVIDVVAVVEGDGG